jgi:hypothetical protein
MKGAQAQACAPFRVPMLLLHIIRRRINETLYAQRFAAKVDEQTEAVIAFMQVEQALLLILRENDAAGLGFCPETEHLLALTDMGAEA